MLWLHCTTTVLCVAHLSWTPSHRTIANLNQTCQVSHHDCDCTPARSYLRGVFPAAGSPQFAQRECWLQKIFASCSCCEWQHLPSAFSVHRFSFHKNHRRHPRQKSSTNFSLRSLSMRIPGKIISHASLATERWWWVRATIFCDLCDDCEGLAFECCEWRLCKGKRAIILAV